MFVQLVAEVFAVVVVVVAAAAVNVVAAVAVIVIVVAVAATSVSFSPEEVKNIFIDKHFLTQGFPSSFNCFHIIFRGS